VSRGCCIRRVFSVTLPDSGLTYSRIGHTFQRQVALCDDPAWLLAVAVHNVRSTLAEGGSPRADRAIVNRCVVLARALRGLPPAARISGNEGMLGR